MPRLWNRPVIVLSNNDGCVVARSAEAKALGISMGVPYFQVRNRCEALGIAVFSANFELYADMSRRVMRCLEQWTDRIEIYSIDEAFLDLTGVLNAETENFGKHVVETVYKWTGIPVSFGIGSTKTLAKIATHAAKERRCGFYALDGAGEVRKILEQIPVDDVWGIGYRTGPKFRKRGVRTAWELSQCDPLAIRREFSIMQERVVRELRGEPCLELETPEPPKFSIQYSRSFGTKIENLDDLEHPVSSFLAAAMEKLRKFHLYTSAVYISFYGHLKGEGSSHGDAAFEYRSFGDTVLLETPQDDTATVLPLVLNKLRKIYRDEISYKKASVTLLGIGTQSGQDKYRMFQSMEENTISDAQQARHRDLMRTLDALHHELGRSSVLFAVEGLEGQTDWQSRHDLKSPAYTTDWNDVPKVK